MIYDEELPLFLKFIKEREITSYLEVGVMSAHVLAAVANAMPKGSLAVGVDLPSYSTSETPEDIPGINHARYIGENCGRLAISRHTYPTMFFGDSQDLNIVLRVNKLAPFDLVYIDADHSYAGVCADWEHYGPMAKRYVAFDDIACQALGPTVGRLWGELKERGYQCEEIMGPRTKSGQGIGIGILAVGSNPRGTYRSVRT